MNLIRLGIIYFVLKTYFMVLILCVAQIADKIVNPREIILRLTDSMQFMNIIILGLILYQVAKEIGVIIKENWRKKLKEKTTK